MHSTELGARARDRLPSRRPTVGLWEDSLLFDLEDGEVRVRVERRPISFAGYEGAWREGKGMSWEEVNAYVRDLRGHDDDG